MNIRPLKYEITFISYHYLHQTKNSVKLFTFLVSYLHIYHEDRLWIPVNAGVNVILETGDTWDRLGH